MLKKKMIGQRENSFFYGMVIKDEDAIFDLDDDPKFKIEMKNN